MGRTVRQNAHVLLITENPAVRLTAHAFVYPDTQVQIVVQTSTNARLPVSVGRMRSVATQLGHINARVKMDTLRIRTRCALVR